MKKILLLALAALTIVTMESCKSSKNTATNTNQDKVEFDQNFTFEMIRGKWMVVEANGKKTDKLKQQPYLIFNLEEMRVNGNAGCNSMGAEIDRRARIRNALAFGRAFSTQKMCLPEAMEAERNLLNALNESRMFERKTDGRLYLIGEGGKIVAILERELVN